MANLEQVREALERINRIFCEGCEGDAESGCFLNHKNKLFLYWEDVERVLKQIEPDRRLR